MCETTSTCLVEAVCVGVVLKDQGPEVFLRFLGRSCLDSSLSLSLSLWLWWFWGKRESSFSLSSRCRFFPIISRRSSGLISCQRGGSGNFYNSFWLALWAHATQTFNQASNFALFATFVASKCLVATVVVPFGMLIMIYREFIVSQNQI